MTTFSRGRLITVEGLDGSGKTTVVSGLLDALSSRGVSARALREPGGVDTSERIRDLVKDPTLRVDPRAEALLYAAARAQLVDELLEPCLAGGGWVLLDRFVDSSLAYQGVGRDLGVGAISAVNAFATGGLAPDRTLLLRIAPHTGRSRQADRGEAPDRLEQAGEPFFAAIAKAYDTLAAADPDRWRVIDAERAAETVLAEALEAIADLLPAG
ncbi:MAG: dTMP kinase [Solirubrobacterales bacterium]|nr:dTMP kinase [Solirubrobacterales bacterium]